MQYWRVGQRQEDPVDLPIQPGTKQLVTVRIMVDTAHESDAHDVVGEMMRHEETVFTKGPIIDWAFGPGASYPLSNAYEEGEAFTAGDDPAFSLRYYVARLSAAAQDYDGVDPVEFRRWVEEILADLDDLVSGLPLGAEQKRLAEDLGAAMQSFIFHDGPDPERLPEFQSLYPGTSSSG